MISLRQPAPPSRPSFLGKAPSRLSSYITGLKSSGLMSKSDPRLCPLLHVLYVGTRDRVLC